MLKRLLNNLTQSVSAGGTGNASGAAAVGPGAYIELLAPIEGSAAPGAGIDLGYEDEYAVIQDQVAKRGHIDDSLIQGNAVLLLGSRGKDLRAAVFLAYSTLRMDGLASAMEALGLLRALIETFGDAVHPRKPAARRAALEWLCNERFIDPLTLRAKDEAEPVLLQLQASVSALVAAVQAWPEEARPDLSGLVQRIELWLDETLRNDLRSAVSQQAQPEPSLPTLLGASQNGEASATTPKSAQEAWALLRKASVMLRADAQWADAGRAVLRAARWASVAELPPHQAGLTRFAAPRKEARAYLENLHSTAQTPAQWDNLLEECARMFNEGSNHLWLDLLAWSDAAYAQLGATRDLARAQLSLDLRGMLARLPLLPTLKFDDGQAFASSATQEWITQQLRPAGNAHSQQPGPPANGAEANTDSDPQTILAAAKQAFKAQGLGAALSLMQTYAQACTSQQERFELQTLMLDLARDAGRRDLALGLARDLAAQVEEFSLAHWAPALAFDCWAKLYALLRVSGEAGQAEAKVLYGRLCGLDAARAADLP
ncbi:type VI secretion system protein TssA [Roseateles koreensis]|uniref:Type VI secretion system protein TssA n=1 Tax=Roseateles koreensis TaxID=2987526 RepID=A0ABT5KUI5_9BURK|nr:type VI secretion system protein TssA [Roseateles koreensis]MDC8786095.1 type VI secretion system protein TssA [Roseateles koreensis]